MQFDILRWLVDYKIDHRIDGHKHCAPGWVNIKCPFCTGNPGYHLGIHLSGAGCNCRRCGKKRIWDVIKANTNGSAAILRQIREKYWSNTSNQLTIPKNRFLVDSLKWPAGIIKEIPKMAEDYLKKRKFNPEVLIETWGIRFTGPIGAYKFRIIAPIFDQGQLVSYQGRCYTGKRELRYKACSKGLEVIEHQNLLYGEWLVQNNHVIVVEGITDAWRLGPGAVATFGISYTKAQVERLSKYKRVSLVFDSDPQAIDQAEKLGVLLRGLNPEIQIDIVELEDGDPGELSAKEVSVLKKSLSINY